MTVVFLSEIPWSGLHQRPQHIAISLSKRWNVLWVEPTTLLKRSYFRPVRVSDRISVLSIPAIPYNARFKIVSTIARPLSRIAVLRGLLSFLQRRLIIAALGKIGADPGDLVFVVHNYHLLHVIEKMHPRFLLYDYIDNAFGFTAMPRHVRRLWEGMLARADAVTVTSLTLKKQVEEIRTAGVHLVGNGVEFEYFSSESGGKRPEDLPSGKPIVGYIGAVYPWLDYELIETAAREMPGIDYVFIGPVHPKIQPLVQGIARLPNVRFLGFRNYNMIRDYLHCFSVCIIPFRRNELTRAVDPVKLYEYSAAGKPTVMTDFSDDPAEYEDVVSIAHSKEEFVTSLRRALDRSHDADYTRRLVAFARRHDWGAKTSQIIDLIQQPSTRGHQT